MSNSKPKKNPIEELTDNKPIEELTDNKPIEELTDNKPVEKSTDDKIVSGTPPLVAPDPFNAKALRLPSAFEHNAGIRKVISDIPVRKPHSQEWIRVHPGQTSWEPRCHHPQG